MQERRNWKTRAWANGTPAADRSSGDVPEMPYLWFLAGKGRGSAFQSWATGPETTFVPCFRSRDEATELAEKAGARGTFVLGFPLPAVPDLMDELDHPIFVVTGIGDTGRVYGHYLPEQPVASQTTATAAPSRAIHAA